MQYTGVITHLGEVEKIGANETPKITFVLEEVTDREYKGSIAVDVWGDKTGLIDGMNVGDEVTAHLNCRSREYNGRYYNSVSAWRLETGAGTGGAPASATDADDDLPF